MPDDHDELYYKISQVLCDNIHRHSAEECYSLQCKTNSFCKNYGKCRISEKTLEQLKYVERDLTKDSFLKACPGSGKTEVVGLKSAYEFKKWQNKTTGIAVLTYTNKATDVITERVIQFAGTSRITHPHFIGTIDGWMHKFILNPFAHLVTEYDGKDEDRSIHIIDKSSDANFLKNPNFATKYSFAHTGSVHANEFYFLDIECMEIIFSSGDFNIDPIRNVKSLDNEMKKELFRIKREFWRSGYLTHEDVDIICYKILNEHPEICKLISNRFNIIIIDECQDLSSHKIDIFNLLKKQGSIFHLVGDIHQSIFSYNNADFEKIVHFSNEGDFTKISLTRNFRSVQSIVNMCSKLVENSEKIVGYENTPEKNHCLIFSYQKDAMHEIPKKFTEFLLENGHDTEKSAILIRNKFNKNSLVGRTNQKITYTKQMPTALYLWSLNNFEFKKESMDYLGRFLSELIFLKEKLNGRNYYCPTSIPSYQWRLFLADLLDSCNKAESLVDLTQNWTVWRKIFNDTFPKKFNKIQARYEWLVSEKIEDNELISTSPKGEKDLPVIKTINIVKHHPQGTIELSTIHSAKGRTYDAILLVSSPQLPVGEMPVAGIGSTGLIKQMLKESQHVLLMSQVHVQNTYSRGLFQRKITMIKIKLSNLKDMDSSLLVLWE